jgi:hypothetical protein
MAERRKAANDNKNTLAGARPIFMSITASGFEMVTSKLVQS